MMRNQSIHGARSGFGRGITILHSDVQIEKNDSCTIFADTTCSSRRNSAESNHGEAEITRRAVKKKGYKAQGKLFARSISGIKKLTTSLQNNGSAAVTGYSAVSEDDKSETLCMSAEKNNSQLPESGKQNSNCKVDFGSTISLHKPEQRSCQVDCNPAQDVSEKRYSKETMVNKTQIESKSTKKKKKTLRKTRLNNLSEDTNFVEGDVLLKHNKSKVEIVVPRSILLEKGKDPVINQNKIKMALDSNTTRSQNESDICLIDEIQRQHSESETKPKTVSLIEVKDNVDAAKMCVRGLNRKSPEGGIPSENMEKGLGKVDDIRTLVSSNNRKDKTCLMQNQQRDKENESSEHWDSEIVLDPGLLKLQREVADSINLPTEARSSSELPLTLVAGIVESTKPSTEVNRDAGLKLEQHPCIPIISCSVTDTVNAVSFQRSGTFAHSGSCRSRLLTSTAKSSLYHCDIDHSSSKCLDQVNSNPLTLAHKNTYCGRKYEVRSNNAFNKKRGEPLIYTIEQKSKLCSIHVKNVTESTTSVRKPGGFSRGHATTNCVKKHSQDSHQHDKMKEHNSSDSENYFPEHEVVFVDSVSTGLTPLGEDGAFWMNNTCSGCPDYCENETTELACTYNIPKTSESKIWHSSDSSQDYVVPPGHIDNDTSSEELWDKEVNTLSNQSGDDALNTIHPHLLNTKHANEFLDQHFHDRDIHSTEKTNCDDRVVKQACNEKITLPGYTKWQSNVNCLYHYSETNNCDVPSNSSGIIMNSDKSLSLNLAIDDNVSKYTPPCVLLQMSGEGFFNKDIGDEKPASVHRMFSNCKEDNALSSRPSRDEEDSDDGQWMRNVVLHSQSDDESDWVGLIHMSDDTDTKAVATCTKILNDLHMHNCELDDTAKNCENDVRSQKSTHDSYLSSGARRVDLPSHHTEENVPSCHRLYNAAEQTGNRPGESSRLMTRTKEMNSPHGRYPSPRLPDPPYYSSEIPLYRSFRSPEASGVSSPCYQRGETPPRGWRLDSAPDKSRIGTSESSKLLNRKKVIIPPHRLYPSPCLPDPPYHHSPVAPLLGDYNRSLCHEKPRIEPPFSGPQRFVSPPQAPSHAPNNQSSQPVNYNLNSPIGHCHKKVRTVSPSEFKTTANCLISESQGVERYRGDAPDDPLLDSEVPKNESCHAEDFITFNAGAENMNTVVKSDDQSLPYTLPRDVLSECANSPPPPPSPEQRKTKENNKESSRPIKTDLNTLIRYRKEARDKFHEPNLSPNPTYYDEAPCKLHTPRKLCDAPAEADIKTPDKDTYNKGVSAYRAKSPGVVPHHNSQMNSSLEAPHKYYDDDNEEEDGEYDNVKAQSTSGFEADVSGNNDYSTIESPVSNSSANDSHANTSSEKAGNSEKNSSRSSPMTFADLPTAKVHPFRMKINTYKGLGRGCSNVLNSNILATQRPPLNFRNVCTIPRFQRKAASDSAIPPPLKREVEPSEQKPVFESLCGNSSDSAASSPAASPVRKSSLIKKNMFGPGYTAAIGAIGPKPPSSYRSQMPSPVISYASAAKTKSLEKKNDSDDKVVKEEEDWWDVDEKYQFSSASKTKSVTNTSTDSLTSPSQNSDADSKSRKTRFSPVSESHSYISPSDQTRLSFSMRCAGLMRGNEGGAYEILYSDAKPDSSKLTRTLPGLDSISWAAVRSTSRKRFQQKYASLTLPFIDTHCHLDFLFERSGFKGTFAEFKELNKDTFPPSFKSCVAVFCNPRTFNADGGLWSTLLDEPGIYGAVGCHPKCATDFNQKTYTAMGHMIRDPRVVAVGEIGLDYSGVFSERAEQQKEVFALQLEMVLEVKKPVVIHCRDAEEDCVNILEKSIPRNYIIHRHCWTGPWKDCETWLNKFPQSFIGLTPLVTHYGARGDVVREVARHLPLDKLLLETDAPYFVPRSVGRHEMQHSHPGMAITVAQQVAEIKGVSLETVLDHCMRNTFQMYGI